MMSSVFHLSVLSRQAIALLASLSLLLILAAESSSAPVAGSCQEVALSLSNAPETGSLNTLHSHSMTASGIEGWLFFSKEIQHLMRPRYWTEDNSAEKLPGDPLPAILDFKQQLDKVGVDLLVVPVPPKCVIYSDKLDSSLGIPSPSALFSKGDQTFYKTLESHGVDVLDLTEDFLSARATGPLPLYCKQDTHWSPAGIQIAAKRIADQLRNLSWVKDQAKIPMRPINVQVAFKGDLLGGTEGSASETVTARVVGTADSSPSQQILPSKSSPVILLGDSHNLVFHAGGDMYAEGAGLPDQLALELGFPVDVVAVRGSGATPARRNLARRKDNLAGKKLVIWCFTAREFTEGEGWDKVPVVKSSAAIR